LKRFGDYVMTDVPLEEYILGTASQIVMRKVHLVESMASKNRRYVENFFRDVLGGELVRICKLVDDHSIAGLKVSTVSYHNVFNQIRQLNRVDRSQRSTATTPEMRPSTDIASDIICPCNLRTQLAPITTWLADTTRWRPLIMIRQTLLYI
jgi:hypothetical protein